MQIHFHLLSNSHRKTIGGTPGHVIFLGPFQVIQVTTLLSELTHYVYGFTLPLSA